MELSCNQENLEKGINTVNKIIGSRANLPVLNNILISTDKGRLKLASTDLEIGIVTWIGAKVEKEGSITVPARLLTEYISTNDDDKINLSTQDDILTLKSDKYQANIKGINASEFPLIPEFKNKEYIEIDTIKLQDLINKTIFACAVDETRPVLTGVLFRIEKNKFKLVATDSYRLAETTTILNKKHLQTTNTIIPARTMSEISRIISLSPSTKTMVILNENQILFSLKNTQITSRLIEGNFPDYGQIIPKNFQTKIKVSVEELTKSLKMASFFARESANNIKIKINENKKIQISAVSPQIGDEMSEFNLESFEGKPTEIAFNAKFFLDILNVIADQTIILEIDTRTSPVVIKPDKTKTLLYIIMPLRIEE